MKRIRLKVRNTVAADKISQFLRFAGTVDNLDIKNLESDGTVIAEMSTSKGAQRAVECLNGQKLNHHSVTIEYDYSARDRYERERPDEPGQELTEDSQDRDTPRSRSRKSARSLLRRIGRKKF